MTTISLSSYAVRDSSGSVDVEATLAKFEVDLVRHIALSETEEAEVAAAVHSVFDQFKGARLNMPALVTFALSRLGASPDNHKVLTERILGYVRANSQGETDDDGNVENPGSMFLIQRGRNGGCWRRADAPAE